MTNPEGDTENWVLLMDPAWAPAAEDETPPLEAVVGLWPIEDGKPGKFRANPEYLPSDANSPTDPLDAVLRLVLQSRAEATHIRLMLRDCLVDVAMNGDGRPLVTPSPDEIACLVVATAEPHRAGIAAPAWQRVDLAELTDLLSAGVHVLFNPGGAASVRLTDEFIRETAAMSDEEVAALYARMTDAQD
ncbi:type VII secretion system-associated protein [Amycolatopsis jejuensis]|uniref:type VII secretion system-associated protein n=1 Tax=Amycolatopsis jejuensis TaxID=330084 RepID=UPI00052752C0|nr:type VII secretion system-associated protein [Amycolatopsis jejuensis]